MIVLVEDNDNEIASMLGVLRRQVPDVEVRVSHTGNETLDMIDDMRPATPALVMLGRTLPDCPAPELLQRLRRNPHTRHVPVVMLSDPGDPGALGRHYDLGANSCLGGNSWSALDETVIGHTVEYWLRLNQRCAPPGEERP